MLTSRTSHQTDWLRLIAREAANMVVVFSSSVVSAVYQRGRSLRDRLGDVWGELAESVQRLAATASLAEAQAPDNEGDKTGLTILGLSGIALAIVLIGVVVLCVLPFCIIIILALLGPAIGNVFSNIVDEI